MKSITLIIFFFIFISCEINEKQSFKTISENPLINYRIVNGDIFIFNSNFEVLDSITANFSEKGIELAQNGNIIESKILFKKALSLAPDSPVILNNLGQVEFYANNFEKAIEYYNESLLKSDSTYLFAAQNLARTYGLIGESENSEKVFEFIINKSDLDFIKGVSYYSLTKMYLDYGEIKKAKLSIKYAKKYFEKDDFFEAPLVTMESRIVNYYK